MRPHFPNLGLAIATTIIVASLGMPVSVLATSGACSWNGGVDCSAGPSLYGYAVCNDGAISSVPYDDMEECQETANPCPSPVVVGCTDQSELNIYLNEQTQDENSCRALDARIGNFSASCDNSSLDEQISSCQAEIQDYQAEVQDYNKCIAGVESVIQQQTNESEELTCAELPNTQWNSTTNQCGCATNYVSVSGVCTYVDPSTALAISNTSQCSSNASAMGGECVCNSGYHTDTYRTYCIANQVVPSTTPTISIPAPTIAPILTPPQPTFTINGNVSVGTSGNNVIQLQEFLENKGLLTLPAGSSNGYFGSLTKQALISFQASNNLPPTGYCGPMTRQLINSGQ